MADKNSATTYEAKIISFPNNKGSKTMHALSKTSVLETETIEDMVPLLRAVKRFEPNIEKPQKA